MTHLQMRCHALQERSEDQSASLKLAKESQGDMQVTHSLYRLPLNNVFELPSGAPYHSGGSVCSEKASFQGRFMLSNLLR